MSSAYLKLLILLPSILIPAFASSSLTFLMMYSAYKLNKQGGNIQPWHTPFPNWNQSVVPCPVLTVSSWPAYSFLKRQVRWSGIPISLRIFHFVEIYTVKGFSIVNEAEVRVFWMLSFKSTFSLSCFTLIKRLFSSSLSAKRVVSSAYLGLLIFLLAVLIPAYPSSRPAFCMMYSA